MVTGGQDPGGEYENLQLTTLQGWRQFVAEMRSVPQLLTGPVWSGLEEDKRAVYDDERVDHHSRYCWWCRLPRSVRSSTPAGA